MSGSSGRGIDTRRRRAVVLDALASSGEVRVPELAARLDVSEMTVRRDLEQLERDGLVKRTVFPTIPPRVDYELTVLGRSLLKPVTELSDWARANRATMDKARARFDAIGTDT